MFSLYKFCLNSPPAACVLKFFNVQGSVPWAPNIGRSISHKAILLAKFWGFILVECCSLFTVEGARLSPGNPIFREISYTKYWCRIWYLFSKFRENFVYRCRGSLLTCRCQSIFFALSKFCLFRHIGDSL